PVGLGPRAIICRAPAFFLFSCFGAVEARTPRKSKCKKQQRTANGPANPPGRSIFKGCCKASRG
ncbi:MAG: hypothetical protein VXW17_05870, partial [Pseudomonadota bacterium]|nr:hypothetical protein [Pseudomonadota bacterium]